ncbi:sensor domain-containing diguanylate cyclase [Acidovorax sp. CCYZU-2555]|uniref:sensor domain-containing diguanylate cyclase n=1 Tax=Acidovorax sp. CCYZU-2555 TaxID=2835042 RepID=UPI001BCDAC4B|nr:sensor domain-containing diguanylate cyclase [Acidovorax sp. CCYZU-2555]MBS7780618.1 sensor domain-containing diguanylate cyclase [Acidovorax sp. CCYZU-2555]
MSEVTEFSNDPTVYQALLESTQAIPWKIDWASMTFAYIGPQIEPLLGWSRESWRSVEDWALRMHPDDRERVVNFCVTQSQAGVDHEADYRALTRDNGYVWIRDVVHVVRNDQGEVQALIGFMFDISERKKTEERLLALQGELEALSFKDGLTNIANRRRFNASLELEWANARRDQQPLSLLMIDIDFFKQYNDLYGHLRGDQCLVDIAQTLNLALDGPRDLAARFGGEEFVILLPGADADMAWNVAQRCQRLIQKQAITHALSPHDRRLTVSIGVGTITPDEQANPSGFADSIDQQLYAAKNNGRNRIERMQLQA